MVFENSIPKEELAKLGKIVTWNGTTVGIEVSRDKAPTVAAHILSKYPVADLTIEEPQIEEIIGTVFASQHV